MKIILLGMVGSGKSTEGKLIEKDFGWKYISTGDLFREEIKTGSKLGKELEEIINKGNLVPDALTYSILKKRLNKIKNDFILDGFPRNLNQARLFDKYFKIDKVMYLEISEEEAIKRITGRKQCSKCGFIFSIYYPSKLGNKCEKCQGDLYVREDDKKEIVEKRIMIYKKETQPLIDYYKNKGILISINGERPINIIFDDIKRYLNNKK